MSASTHRSLSTRGRVMLIGAVALAMVGVGVGIAHADELDAFVDPSVPTTEVIEPGSLTSVDDVIPDLENQPLPELDDDDIAAIRKMYKELHGIDDIFADTGDSGESAPAAPPAAQAKPAQAAVAGHRQRAETTQSGRGKQAKNANERQRLSAPVAQDRDQDEQWENSGDGDW